MEIYKDEKIFDFAPERYFSMESRFPDDETQETITSILSLFQSSTDNFNNQCFDDAKNDFIELLKILKDIDLDLINQDYLMHYSEFLLFVITQTSNQKKFFVITFYALKIIKLFVQSYTIKNQILDLDIFSLLKEMLNHEDESIKHLTIFILSDFSTTSAEFFDSSIFNDLCLIFKSEAELNATEKVPLLCVISQIFNNLVKYDEQINIKHISSICEIYSLALKQGSEELLTQFINFCIILNHKLQQFSSEIASIYFQSKIVPIMFEFELPQLMYPLLNIDPPNEMVNQAFYFFTFLTSIMNEEHFDFFSPFFDFSMLLFKISNETNLLVIKYGLQIVKNLIRIDRSSQFLDLVCSDDFLAFLRNCLEDTDYNVKLITSFNILSILAVTPNLHIIQKLFESDILIMALEMFDSDNPQLIVEILTLFENRSVLSRIEQIEFGADQFFKEFQSRFYQYLEEFYDSENDEIRIAATSFFSADAEEDKIDEPKHDLRVYENENVLIIK